MADKSRSDRIIGMIDAATKAAGGDFSVRIAPSGKDDALEALGQAINKLMDKLREKVAESAQAKVEIGGYKEKYRQLQANIPGMVYLFVMHPDGTFSFPYVNEGSKKLFGISPEDLMRDATLITRLIHPYDRERFDTSVRHSAETLQPWREVLRHIVDGQVRWYDCMSRPELQSTGDILWNGIILEVTDRMNMEESLSRSQKELSDIIAISPVGIAIYDGKGICTSTNDSFTRIVGATKQQVLGQNYADIESWKKTGLLDMARTAIRTHSAKRHEVVTTSSLGKEVFLDCHLVPFGEEALLLMAQDITERKRAEEEIRQSEKQFKTLFMSIPDGFYLSEILFDDNGNPCDYRYIEVNPKFEQIIGLSRDQIIGKRYKELVPVDTTGWLDAYRTVARTGTPLTYEFYSNEYQMYFETYSYQPTKGQISVFVRDITARKRAEEALSESEATLRNIYESSPMLMGIVELTKDDKILHIYDNPATARFFHVPFQGTKHKTADELGAPSDAIREWIVAYRQSQQQGKPVKFEYVHHTPDGPLWLSATVSVIGPAPNGRTRFSYVAEDITGRRKSLAALEESELRFRRVMEESPIGIAIYDASGQCTAANDAIARIVGATREQALGQNYNEIKSWKRSGLYELAKRAVAENTTVRQDAVTVSTFGKEVHLDCYFLPFGLGNLLLMVQDIGDRKRAEDALRQSEERLRQALRVANIGIFDHDHPTNTIYWSAKQREIHGWGPEEVITLPAFLELVHPEDRETIEAAVQRAHNPASDGSWDVEHRIIRRDGDIRWLSARSQTFFEGEGDARRPVRTVGAVRDITEATEAEHEREMLQAQLTQAQKMESVGRLAGGVAHDFNNMLTVILGYTELIKAQTPADDPIMKNMLEIEKAARHSRDVTRQLLAFSRKQIIAPRDVDLNDLIPEIKKTLSRLIGEDINLQFYPGKDLWKIRFDPSQIDQILVNLAVNARDAMPNGGILTLETANVLIDEEYCRDHLEFTPGHYVVLTVSDNGVGMDKETLSHVFEPFFTTKEIGKGTGLGLATIYGIVRQSGGFINVYSEPGRGTTFKILVPRILESYEIPDKTEEAPVHSVTGTILLVEDDDMVRRMTTRMLETIGHTVLVAETPFDAISWCENPDTTIDLLLTDVVMPEMNGAELAARIAAIRPGIKVLFMSGYTSNVILHRGILEEGVHFVHKPFSINLLARKIFDVIKGQ